MRTEEDDPKSRFDIFNSNTFGTFGRYWKFENLINCCLFAERIPLEFWLVNALKIHTTVSFTLQSTYSIYLSRIPRECHTSHTFRCMIVDSGFDSEPLFVGM